MLAVAISVLALIGTFYQLYLQRVHNEKSLKPLPQIDLVDRGGMLSVHVQNNGVGPMIVEKLIFRKGEESYLRIQDCLPADPASYEHIEITAANSKVILPNKFLEVFSKQFIKNRNDADIETLRMLLATITLTVEGRDIYNNRVVVAKSFAWFARHVNKA